METLETVNRDKSRRAPLTPAERKRRQRERNASRLTITIELTEAEADGLARAYEIQGPHECKTDFYRAALLTGAAFVANAGTPRGSKIQTR